MIPVGRVSEIVRYPVKSMAGIPAESAVLGWHGIEGDRRFAFRRVGVEGGMPWLTASRLPELVLYRPEVRDDGSGEPLPTHVSSPDGSRLALRSAELTAEISARCGGPVELMKLDHGIFDETPISVIGLATIAGIGRDAGIDLDRRRFRANIFLETERREIFLEDDWVGGVLAFGDDDSGPAVAVTMRDLRCGMVNVDPDTAKPEPRVMKTIVRANANYAGVYGSVLQTGTIRIGDRVSLASD
ncbi:MAG TPA: MOSC N-terminal beta barrel domain-containing protein [Thermoanaerobaculia bacterium]|nr:MOSC N-terminal beta barrel domain-containing protein [Thermoanaerobaculia bacterium]